MAKAKKVNVRRSILELAEEHKKGNTKPLDDLMRAWKGIKELPHTDPRSFFMLGGYHGEPFRGAGWGFGNATFWGGYCNHGNVLFPTWHRVYLLKLEEALQSIKGCADVMLPYWDETDEYSLKNGIPWPLTDEYYTLDGKQIDNPLRSFVLPITITDNVSTDNGIYTKPKGYETVRYPLSGLVGTPEAKAATKAHNSLYPDYNENVKLLNENVMTWLNNKTYVSSDGKHHLADIYSKYVNCLNAPNYTVFSNTTSAQEWNQINEATVVPLESPHNDIHLSVGGYDVNDLGDQNGNFSHIPDANGDMGENDTAGLDPIFFFHHCNVDRMFWLWQKKWGKTDELDIILDYPGTNSSDSQGATPGIAPNTWLDLDTPLNPFKKSTGLIKKTYTSNDAVNIETQLGYTYSPGSLEDHVKADTMLKVAKGNSTKIAHISGINRAPIKGSFVVALVAKVNGEKILVGTHSVLSRWSVMGCANCQTHLEVKASFPLSGFAKDVAEKAQFETVFLHREQDTSEFVNRSLLSKKNQPRKMMTFPHKLEIR